MKENTALKASRLLRISHALTKRYVTNVNSYRPTVNLCSIYTIKTELSF